jgi:hypothetical protein
MQATAPHWGWVSSVLSDTWYRYSAVPDIADSWTGHKSGSGLLALKLRQYFITIGSETTFPRAFCVIRSLSYLVWSRTFLLGVGLTDLGDLGRHLGGNNAIVSVFNGPIVYVNV